MRTIGCLASPAGGRQDTVAQVLGNVSYIGMTYVNRTKKEGELIRGQWPGLIDGTTWVTVQRMLDRYHRKGGRKPAAGQERAYVFQGLLRCLKCGRRMHCHPHEGPCLLPWPRQRQPRSLPAPGTGGSAAAVGGGTPGGPRPRAPRRPCRGCGREVRHGPVPPPVKGRHRPACRQPRPAREALRVGPHRRGRLPGRVGAPAGPARGAGRSGGRAKTDPRCRWAA